MAATSLLGGVPLFASLSEEALRAVEAVCRRRVFKRGETLFYEEDPGNALYIVQTGQVKIVRLAPDGEERILHLEGPGECLGELSLIDGAPRSAKAVALDRVEALVLYREEFLALVDRHPAVARAVMSGLAGMVRRLSEQVQDLTALDVPGRIAKKLLELADSHGQKTEDGVQIALPLTQQELADMIGATRVAVNQALSWFRGQGILTTDRQGITLRQPEKLKQRVY
jgi:CRP/FNR family transcriptional regulator/CRP/FNR family cyclic AMP-dependent transcriptional regulator